MSCLTALKQSSNVQYSLFGPHLSIGHVYISEKLSSSRFQPYEKILLCILHANPRFCFGVVEVILVSNRSMKHACSHDTTRMKLRMVTFEHMFTGSRQVFQIIFRAPRGFRQLNLARRPRRAGIQLAPAPCRCLPKSRLSYTSGRSARPRDGSQPRGLRLACCCCTAQVGSAFGRRLHLAPWTQPPVELLSGSL